MVEITKAGNLCSSARNPERGESIAIGRCTQSLFTGNANEIALLYIKVFGGGPWYEKYLVQINGKWERVGSPQELEQLERLKASGVVKEEQIKSYYQTSDVLDNIRRVAESKGFVASIAWCSGKIIAVSWGMSASSIPSEEKMACVKTVLEMQKLSPDRTTYFDETFVDPDYQGKGIGKVLVKIRGTLAANEMGCTNAIVRTINPIQIRALSSEFGKDNVRPVYQNKEDIQAERKYYVINLLRG